MHDRSKYHISYKKGEKQEIVDRGDVLILRTNKKHTDLEKLDDVMHIYPKKEKAKKTS